MTITMTITMTMTMTITITMTMTITITANKKGTVWQQLVMNPTDMIKMNEQDGSFYTEMPTMAWRSLHSHAHLAQAAGSPLLHVMVAAKIATAVVSMARRVTAYVESIDEIIRDDSELKEVELEYLCALANDIATHIEEVIALVDGFTIAEVRSYPILSCIACFVITTPISIPPPLYSLSCYNAHSNHLSSFLFLLSLYPYTYTYTYTDTYTYTYTYQYRYEKKSMTILITLLRN